MKEKTKDGKIKRKVYRIFYYVFGLLILALGICLNTKCLLGVSAIISVPYVVSQIGGFNFGNATFVAYTIMVLAQFGIKGKNRTALDLLQIPLSIVFTRFLNVYNYFINFNNMNITEKILVLILAVICTGIGAAMSVNMRLVANPGDAFVSSIADRTGKTMGLIKNIVDISCVIISVIVGFMWTGSPIGIGIGTLVSMVGVGRVIAIFNKLFKEKIEIQSGIKR